MAWLASILGAMGSGAAAGGAAAGAGSAATAAGAASAGAGAAAGSSALGNIMGMLGKGGGSTGIPSIDQPGVPRTYSHLNPPQSPGEGNEEFIKMMNTLAQFRR